MIDGTEDGVGGEFVPGVRISSKDPAQRPRHLGAAERTETTPHLDVVREDTRQMRADGHRSGSHGRRRRRPVIEASDPLAGPALRSRPSCRPPSRPFVETCATRACS